MRFFRPFVVTMLLTVPQGISSQTIDHDRYRFLMKQLSGNVQSKDWQGARATLAEVGAVLPAPTPRYLLLVASVEAHLGHNSEALQWLQRYSATGLSLDARDEGIKAVLAGPTGEPVAAQLRQNGKAISHAQFVCALPQADIMPEDIAYIDGKPEGTFVVSSVQHHTLYRVSLPRTGGQDCKIQDLRLPREARAWPMLAVAFDRARKVLWATTAAMPGFSGFPREDSGKSALLQVDAATGRLLRRFDLHAGVPAVLGDMCVALDGTVYVTDSIGGGVYRLRGDLETAKLEKIADGLFSPQTPALARDGKRLFVADYSMGIAVIDLSADLPSRPAYLPHPDTVAVVGIDGLYLDADSLLAIQNGTEPMRIVRLKLDREQNAIVSAEVIEQGSASMGDPTHAVRNNASFYVTANVGWNSVDDNTGKLKPGASFSRPALLRVPGTIVVDAGR